MTHLQRPIGKCEVCGQEFMSRNGLRGHKSKCPGRQEQAKVETTPPETRFKAYQPRVALSGGATVWVPRR